MEGLKIGERMTVAVDGVTMLYLHNEFSGSSGLRRIARWPQSIARSASPPNAAGAHPNKYAKAQDALSANVASNASTATLRSCATRCLQPGSSTAMPPETKLSGEEPDAGKLHVRDCEG
jgi:hypothetical protein